MYKVKNISKHERKFLDRKIGKWIYVKPRESVLTMCPPEENEVWKIDDAEKKEKKEKIKRDFKKIREVKENDSSSS